MRRALELILWFILGSVCLGLAASFGALPIYAILFPAVIVYGSYIHAKIIVGDKNMVETPRKNLSKFSFGFVDANIFSAYCLPVGLMILLYLEQNEVVLSYFVEKHTFTIDLLLKEPPFSLFKPDWIEQSNIGETSKVLVIDFLFACWFFFMLWSIPVLNYFSNIAIQIKPLAEKERNDPRLIKGKLVQVAGGVVFVIFLSIIILFKDASGDASFYGYSGGVLVKRLISLAIIPVFYFGVIEFFLSHRQELKRLSKGVIYDQPNRANKL